MTLVLPSKRKNDDMFEEDILKNKRCASTQTEESPVAVRCNNHKNAR